MKYAADFCQRRNTRRRNAESTSSGWNSQSLGKKIFDILYPIVDQISKLDIGGRIILQPGLAGQEAARDCFEEVLLDILIISVDVFSDTSDDSGLE